MSGGYFMYDQYRIDDICCEIEEIIKNNSNYSLDDWGDPIGRGYSEETIAKFKEAVTILKKASVAAQRIDWLLSGDDGEDSFHERWDEEMGKIS